MSTLLRLGLALALLCVSPVPAAVAKTYSVQAVTCNQRASAESVAAELRRRGHSDAYVYQHTSLVKRMTWYVVRLGDFKTLAGAQKSARSYSHSDGVKVLITPKESLRTLRVVAPPAKAYKIALAETPASVSKADRQVKAVSELNQGPPKEVASTQAPVPAEETLSLALKKKAHLEISAAAADAIHAAGPAKPEPAAASSAVSAYTLAAMKKLSTEEASVPEASVREVSENEAASSDGEAAEAEKTGSVPTPGTDAPPPPPAALKELHDQVDHLQQEVKDLRDQTEIRKKLELTETEKAEKEKEILSAAGREYTLLKRNTIGVEYNLNYTYYSTDTIRDFEEDTSIVVEQRDNHTFKNSLLMEYALLNNITLNVNAPFVYKYDRTGRSDEMDVTDIGDVSAGFQYQPLRSKGGRPAFILFGSYTIPWGRSPYEINPETELSTGQGYPSARGGLSLSKTIDPIMAYGSVGYSYNFMADNLHQIRRVGDEIKELTQVEPGDSVDLSLGFGLALSYNVSLNTSFQYSYHFSSKYTWDDGTSSKTADSTGATVSIGTGWRISPKSIVNLKVGMGLTQNDPDFTFSLRVPFEFNRGH